MRVDPSVCKRRRRQCGNRANVVGERDRKGGSCKAPRTRGDGLRPVHCFFWNSVGLLLPCLKMIKIGLLGLLLKPQHAGAEPSQLSKSIGILRQCQRRQRLPPLTMPRHCNKSFNELSRWGSCPSDFIISC